MACRLFGWCAALLDLGGLAVLRGLLLKRERAAKQGLAEYPRVKTVNAGCNGQRAAVDQSGGNASIVCCEVARRGVDRNQVEKRGKAVS
jgi:hypothetical protein